MICNFSTYLDGNPMMRAATELQQRAQACPVGEKASQEFVSLAPATRLYWDIDARFIQLAERDFQSIRDDQSAIYEIEGIGKRFLMEQGFQPIPVFIVALQMAIRELVGRDLRITQFMTMSRFRYMDLVTPNVTTPAMIRFVEYMSGADVQNQQTASLLREAMIDNDELMELLLPVLRADFQMNEMYVYEPAPPLDVPIVAYGGIDDKDVDRARLQAWQEQTTAGFSLEMFEGGHFFFANRSNKAASNALL